MPRMTQQEYDAYLLRGRKVSNYHPIQSAEPQRPVFSGSMGQEKGEAKGSSRVRLRIESRRSRLIDPDNLCAKYITDCLRYAGILRDDSDEDIEYIIRQLKVPKGQECTVITIEGI